MKKGLLFICLFSFLQVLNAQLGFNTGYQYSFAPDWKKALIKGYELPADAKVFPASSFTSLDIAIRSKKRGSRILPEIYYSKFEFDVPYETGFTGNALNQFRTDIYKGETFGFLLNFDFFPWSFKKKAIENRLLIGQQGWWKEALFFRLGLGFASMKKELRSSINSPFEFPDGFFRPSNRLQASTLLQLRLGIGYDLNVSSFLSISPLVQWTYAGRTNWFGFGTPTSSSQDFFPSIPSSPTNRVSIKSHFLQTAIGIRLSIHFRKMSQHIRNITKDASL